MGSSLFGVALAEGGTVIAGMEISKMLRLIVISAAVTWWCKSTSFVSYPTTGRGAHTQVYLGHGYQERMSPRAHDPGYAEPDTKVQSHSPQPKQLELRLRSLSRRGP